MADRMFYPLVDCLGAELEYRNTNKVGGTFSVEVSDNFSIQFEVVFSWYDSDKGMTGLFMHAGEALNIGLLFDDRNKKYYLVLVDGRKLKTSSISVWKSVFGKNWSTVASKKIVAQLGDSVKATWTKAETAEGWQEASYQDLKALMI